MKKIRAYVCCKILTACLYTGTLLADSSLDVEKGNSSGGEVQELPQKSEISSEKKEEKNNEVLEKSFSEKSEKEVDFKIDSSLCTKEVLMTFFPVPIVKAVLIWHKVPEAQAESIAKELSQDDQEVVKTVESRASQLDPNPLSDLAQRDTAVKIFRETLFQVFAKTLKDHGVKVDDNQIQVILDDMQQIKGKLFVECIKKERS